MKAVIERVKKAKLYSNGEFYSEIGKGLLVFLGVEKGDTALHAETLAKKIALMRIFEDEDGKMNISASDKGYEIMAVSNFTLAADIKKGNRPSFTLAEEPEAANNLYEHFCKVLSEFVTVKKGVFRTEMQIENVCDGPVTIVADTDLWVKNV